MVLTPTYVNGLAGSLVNEARLMGHVKKAKKKQPRPKQRARTQRLAGRCDDGEW